MVLRPSSRSTGGGISGSMVRDLMLEAVESRFGAIRAPQPVEWLSDKRQSLHRRGNRRLRQRTWIGALLHAGCQPGVERHR